MKIVHICLCDPYNDNWAYHRNILSEQNQIDGHETFIITSAYDMDQEGKAGKERIGTYKNKYGIQVICLPNRSFFSKQIQTKINTVVGLYDALVNINPDIIMVHNLQSFNMYEIVKYRKKHDVLLLGDSHASFRNSCRNSFSKYIVQGIFFRKVIKDTFKYFDNFYFIGSDEHYFFEKEYGINVNPYNVLPLPSRLISVTEKKTNRENIRKQLGISNELLLVHSGKMVNAKKTKDILLSLNKRSENFKLLIIGSIPEENKEIIDLINSDHRFLFLGWKDSSELTKFISAADLYLQPGSPSITLQSSLCAGTPVLVNDNVDIYHYFYNGWEIPVNNSFNLDDAFENLFTNRYSLKSMSQKAFITAHRFFDSEIFASEMYQIKKENKRPSINGNMRIVCSNLSDNEIIDRFQL